MKVQIDNAKAIENIRQYLTKETEPRYVVAALDDAYYALAQAAARAIDKADCDDVLMTHNGGLEETLYNLHRLRSVMVED